MRSVAESKGHVDVFEKAKRSCYSCFRDVRRRDRDLMIAFDKVYGGKNGAMVELICKVVQVRERIGVWSCGGVEAAVIAAGTPATIFLRHHMKRRGPWTV